MAKRLARILALVASILLPFQANAFVGHVDNGGSIHIGVPSSFIDFHLTPDMMFQNTHIAIENPVPGFWPDIIRAYERSKLDKLELILANPESYIPPSFFDLPGIDGQIQKKYIPNGAASKTIYIPAIYGSVRWRILYNGCVILDTTNSSNTATTVTLTKTGTQSGANYDQADGTNIFTGEVCFNSSCTNKYTSTLEIIADSWGGPAMGVKPGSLKYPLPDGTCGLSAIGRLVGNGGDIMCASFDPVWDDDSSDAFFNADEELKNALFRFTTIGVANFQPLAVYPAMNEAEKGLCDASKFECLVIINAAIQAVAAAKECGFTTGVLGTSNAIQHAVWAALIAKRLSSVSSPAIAAARAKAWTDAHETTPGTGCISPPPGGDEEMDCANNAYGISVFLAAPSGLGAKELRELIYANIKAGAGTVIVTAEICNI